MKRSVVVLVLAVLIALALPLKAAQAQGLISLQEAINIAQSFYPSAKVIKTELVQGAQPPYYIIGLDNGRSVYINALNREIMQIISAQLLQSGGGVVVPPNNGGVVVPPRNNGRTVVPPAGAPGASISYGQAVQIAQNLFPNTFAVKVKFKNERKYGYMPMWEVKLSNGYEVYVNATNGSIVRYYYDD